MAGPPGRSRGHLGFIPPSDSLAHVAGDAFGIVGTLQADAFRVTEAVAEGGFAVVYRAHHTQFRADVALKCLKVPGTLTLQQREDFLESFRTEAELLFRLSSAISTVVRPLHVGQLKLDDQRFVPFMALEWLEGNTLAEQLQKRASSGRSPHTLREMLVLLTPAAKALEKAHHFPGPQGPFSVVHRDLKPENLFLATSGGEEVLKILDFGIAKVKRTATQFVGKLSMDQSGVPAFTPDYAAPEQWLPKRFGQTGTWTDVWGLALTAVEVLTGRSPLEGDLAELMGTAIDPEQRPTPRNGGASVSDEVEAVFTKALAVKPADRYATVGAFWNALEGAAGFSCAASIERTPQHESLPPEALDAAQRELARPLSLAVFSGSLPSPPTRPPPPARTETRQAVVENAGGAARADQRDPSNYGELDLDDDGICLGVSTPSLDVESSSADTSGYPAEPKPLQPTPGPRAAEAHLRVADGISLDVNVSEPPRKRMPGAQPTWQQPPIAAHTLLQRLGAPLKLLGFSLAIMVADRLYTAGTHEILSFGPIRPLWVAGPLAIVSLGMIIYTVLSSE